MDLGGVHRRGSDSTSTAIKLEGNSLCPNKLGEGHPFSTSHLKRQINSGKQRKEMNSTWPHGKEEQRDPGTRPSKVILGVLK